MDDMYANVIMSIAIVLLIVLSAFFSSLETAISTVNNVRIRHMAENGNKKALNVLYVLDNYDKAISTILIGNNIVNIACSSLATVLFVKLLGEYGALASTIVITVLVLTFGEITPKNAAKVNAEKICLANASILKTLMVIFRPLSVFFTAIGKLTSKSGDDAQPSVTEDELKFIVETIEEEGVLEEQEREMVQSVLDFDETTAQEIVTPRVNVIAIDINDAPEKIKKTISETRFSRIPVYEESIDNIIGVLHSREYLEEIVAGREPILRDLLHQPYFVYKTKNLSSILNEFKRNKVNFAIVSDDYGGALGIFTMEDLLEEIVGEIWDEDEEIETEFLMRDDNTAEVSGDMNISDVFEIFGLKENYIDADSLSSGGWAMEFFDNLPSKGDSFQCKDLTVTVLDVSDRYINKLLFQYEPKLPEEHVEKNGKKDNKQ